MGGKSTQTQQTNQSSTTNPWEPAQPMLQGMLSQLQAGLSGTGVTGAENNALNTITANAGNASQFAPGITNLVGDLLKGGGATNETGRINQYYDEYKKVLDPIAGGAGNINPALKTHLDTTANDIQTRINGMFAGAGRDLSGANVINTARGIAEGTAPIIANQHNIDAQRSMDAALARFNAGNTTSGLVTGLNQQSLSNRQTGAGMAPAALDAQNAGANSILQAEAARRGIPVQALGLLANIGIPIAGLGGQSTGQSTQRGERQMSGVEQFMGITSGLSNLFGGRR